MFVAVAIFAHNEERRIAACLASLPLDRPDTRFHVLVNGSTDATAERARATSGTRTNVIVHELNPGGKSRTWNRFVHDLAGDQSAYIFLDGDAEISAGSIDALVATLAPKGINAAAGMPLNGRSAAAYRQALRQDRGLFGDLYALSGDFVSRIRAAGLHLPDDLIGDDGLVAAWAMTDLGPDSAWDANRILPCDDAGFLCEPVSIANPATWTMQYKRMTNYSVRYFQSRIVSDIMGRVGPAGLPDRLATLYPDWLPRLKPRRDPTVWWFDRLALKRMKSAL